MNVFDFLFENTSSLEKKFLVGKEELSFGELYRKSVALSGFIRKTIGEDKNILLISHNNAFFLTAYLAILKSGNVVIPLDPAIEEEKFHYISNLTHASLFFLVEQAQKRLNLYDEKCITASNLPTDDYADYVINLNNFDTEKCAEIIFTSGSTGTPKGVMLSHKNIIANTKSIIQYLNLGADDRMLVVLPFYYCYGLSLLHTHLRTGGSLVFNNSFIFLGSVINDLKSHKCTGFAGVPSHYQILLRKSDSFKTTEFPDLKYVTQAGGKLATVFIDEFRQAFQQINFFVMYGQTEATARLSFLSPEIYEKRKGSIGKGIPDVQLKVVKENGEDIKPGETGEVIAKGDNIMMGYFKDEDGTREAIKKGWLYTGDLGSVDDEGYIYLTARKKEIIKVGGKRISPKEIEAVILSLPEVIDCTIEGIEDEILGEALKATIVVNNSGTRKIDENVIKEHCTKNLALYKVPQFIEIKEQINMSATGKKIKNKE
jgi:long-chain acyl-CoA synthetase